MTGSWAPQQFPDLAHHDHTVTSPRANRYNCIAWAAGNDTRWWWPDSANIGYWPSNIPREETVDAFVNAYVLQGYSPCSDGVLEAGFEKVVIYALRSGAHMIPTHAARQLPDGRWTSKLGTHEDIDHDVPEALNGPLYGTPVQFLKRIIPRSC